MAKRVITIGLFIPRKLQKSEGKLVIIWSEITFFRIKKHKYIR